MTTLQDILNKLDDVTLLVQDLPAQFLMSGANIVVVGGLSDIAENLGLIQAGEFRTGNGELPGNGFSGVRIAYPSMTYDSEEWHIVGINNDTLQFGLRASDGAALAGAGAVVIDENGIVIDEGQSGVNSVSWSGFSSGLSAKVYAYEGSTPTRAVAALSGRNTNSAGVAYAALEALSGISGSDTTFVVRAEDTGDNYAQLNQALIIGTSTVENVVPDGILHVYRASAGSVTAAPGADEVIIEGSANVGLSFLSPNDAFASIIFGDPDDNNVGRIRYDHNTDRILFYAGANYRAYIDLGLVVGSPAGGDQGAGTINAVAVYDDGAGPLTDYLWDLWVDGEMRDEDAEKYPDARLWSIDETQDFVVKHRHFPEMPSREDDKASMGELIIGLLATIENQQMQIFELNQRLQKLESNGYIV